MYRLRDYQEGAIAALRASMARLPGNRRRVILVAPTGSGKTVIACHVAQATVEKGNTVLFLAHRKELIDQMAEKLRANGVEHGVIKAGERSRERWSAPVQIASKDTLYSRVFNRESMTLPQADLVVSDECHRSTGGVSWTKILDHYEAQGTPMLGLTATPARQNGKQLGEFWKGMVVACSYKELIESGSLVPTRVIAPTAPDLKGVKIRGGDYEKRALERAVNRTELVGDILDTWQTHAANRPTVIFASGVAHSLHLCDTFRDAGVAIEHLDGKTDPYERMDILHRLATGHLQAVSNVGVLTEGTDIPILSCAVLARPTRSLVLYRQMSGRIQRPALDKSDALVLDHAGAVWEHGFPDDDIHWNLDRGTAEHKERRQRELAQQLWVCESCHRANEGGQRCVECGAIRPRRVRQAVGQHTRPGVLREVLRHEAHGESDQVARQRYWDRALGMAIGKKLKVGAAAHIYKNRYGVFPKAVELDRVPDTGEDWRLPALDWYRKMKETT